MGDGAVLYKRVLLKLSGEALMGDLEYGIEPGVIQRMAEEIREVRALGIEVAIVIGGGNIFRGAGLPGSGMDRVTGDYMGMLATVMNALAIQDALEALGRSRARNVGDPDINEVCEDYIRRRAVRHLEKERRVVILRGRHRQSVLHDRHGGASLRAIEINADVLMKATKVSGVYDSDPQALNSEAVALRHRVSFDKVLVDKLNVMDATRDRHVPRQQPAAAGLQYGRARFPGARDGRTPTWVRW